MTIEEQLLADQKQAMKSGDTATLNAIRSVRAEISAAKSAPGFSGDVDDALHEATIATYVKRIRKAKAEYDSLGDAGVGQSEKLAHEIDYLVRFLPQKLDEAATRELVEATIADIGADVDTPKGKVIGAVMKSGADLDGALVNRLVTELLEQ